MRMLWKHAVCGYPVVSIENILFSGRCLVTLHCSLCSDTFNENSPPSNDPTYISMLGAAVYRAMSQGDKDAVWLMQVWSSISHLIHPSVFRRPIALSLESDVNIAKLLLV